MALVGNMIDDAFAGNPAIVNYTIFVAAFGVFTLLYLTPASFNVDWSGHPAIMILLDTLNALFFLTCGIALAAKLRCRDCSNEVRRLLGRTRNLYCIADFSTRSTPRVTVSPTALSTVRSAAARRKHLLHSSGLLGLDSPAP